jgi:hypothetical protein
LSEINDKALSVKHSALVNEISNCATEIAVFCLGDMTKSRSNYLTSELLFTVRLLDNNYRKLFSTTADLESYQSRIIPENLTLIALNAVLGRFNNIIETVILSLYNLSFSILNIDSSGFNVRQIISKIYFIGMYAADVGNVEAARFSKLRLNEFVSSFPDPMRFLPSFEQLIGEVYQPEVVNSPSYSGFLSARLTKDAWSKFVAVT